MGEAALDAPVFLALVVRDVQDRAELLRKGLGASARAVRRQGGRCGRRTHRSSTIIGTDGVGCGEKRAEKWGFTVVLVTSWAPCPPTAPPCSGTHTQ